MKTVVALPAQTMRVAVIRIKFIYFQELGAMVQVLSLCLCVSQFMLVLEEMVQDLQL